MARDADARRRSGGCLGARGRARRGARTDPAAAAGRITWPRAPALTRPPSGAAVDQSPSSPGACRPRLTTREAAVSDTSSGRRKPTRRRGAVAAAAALAVAVLLAAVVAAAGVGRASVVLGGDRAPREQRTMALLIRRGLPVFCAGGRRRQVALTFDDGPSAQTSQLVSLLRRAGVPATFFEIGEQAARLPSLTRLEGTAGPVGDHTQTHANLTAEPPRLAAAEIAAGRTSIQRVLGQPVQLFRPPGDHRNRTTDRLVAAQHMLTVGYTVDPPDWALRSSGAVLHAVTSDPRLVSARSSCSTRTTLRPSARSLGSSGTSGSSGFTPSRSRG